MGFPCGSERMCDPCWRGTPDQAWAICNTVGELTVFTTTSGLDRNRLTGVLGTVCNRTLYLKPDSVMEKGVEERLLELGVEVHPRTLMLSASELDE